MAVLTLGGALSGALAWALGAALSGRFEPFDSWAGFLTTQLVLCGAAFFAGLARGGKPWMPLLTGAYIGLNVYAYACGSSEARVWFAIGTITTLTLLVLPLIAGLFGAGVRWMRRRNAGRGDD